MPDPGPDPADRPLSSVIDDLEAGRGSGQFRAVDGGRIQCLTCREIAPAAEQRAEPMERLEGASDPDDQAGVVMVTCSSCGAEGSLVLRYGPDAPIEDAEVLRALG
jgi:hypothetical protein